MKRHRGVTRTVFVGTRWAVKVPSPHYVLRGWLANQSEWRQRRRAGVNRPVATVGHVATLYRAADRVGCDADVGPFGRRDEFTYDGDEEKPSNWGVFDGEWRLIDFDRAWERPRGIVGRLYYANQARLARKWSRLPAAVDGR